MLKALSIRNIVLIERLDLEFESGLCVLTGETGSGKSILLDALGLAIGVRADSDLIKLGEKQSTVIAEFVLNDTSELFPLLKNQGIQFDNSLILRRLLTNDGRSRAFINDQPVSGSFLREVGEKLVEMNSQMEAVGLLDPSKHGALVDTFGRLGNKIETVKASYRVWKDADKKLKKEFNDYTTAVRDEQFLRHSVEELDKLDVQPGEEELLTGQRTMMMHSEKLVHAISNSLEEMNSGQSVDERLRSALQNLERVAQNSNGLLDDGILALERAIIEVGETNSELENAVNKMDIESIQSEKVEERLFAIRALARKHQTDVAGLYSLRKELSEKLTLLDNWTSRLNNLKGDVENYKSLYIKSSGLLTDRRKDAARAIDKAIKKEFIPLKLDSVIFHTSIEKMKESEWGENGVDRLSFQVQTNPNTPKGPIHKIVSGGELARLLLALKVVLAGTNTFPTIIFDEIDSGIGGAVAAAVGERLARLSEVFQVLVVTHSPQVAAKGCKHLLIKKIGSETGNHTLVDDLGSEERAEEIARMLSGSQVNEAARAAAKQLLNRSNPEQNLL